MRDPVNHKKSKEQTNNIVMFLCVCSGELHPSDSCSTVWGKCHDVLCLQRPQHECQHGHMGAQLEPQSDA